MSLGYAVPRTERCVVPTFPWPATARDAHAASPCYFSYTAASPPSSPSIVQVVVQHSPLIVSCSISHHLALRPLNAPYLSCLIASPISLIVLRSPSHCPSPHRTAHRRPVTSYGRIPNQNQKSLDGLPFQPYTSKLYPPPRCPALLVLAVVSHRPSLYLPPSLPPVPVRCVALT